MCILIPSIISFHHIGCNTGKKEEEPIIQYKKKSDKVYKSPKFIRNKDN